MRQNIKHIGKGAMAFLPLALAILSFLLATYKSFSHQNHTAMTTIHQIQDSVYFIEGQGGNIGVLSTNEGVLIVDDQFAHAHDQIIKTISSINPLQVKYVVNTHWHVDHTNGNEKFGEEGSVIVAQKGSAERMKTEQTIEVFNHRQMPYNQYGQASKTFVDSLTLHLGGNKVYLEHISHAHTDGDLFVYFQDQNVIHTGDIFVTYGYPFIDEPNGGTIQGVIKGVKRMLEISDKNTKFLPGHGHVSTRSDMLAYLKMLEIIFDRIQSLHIQGYSSRQILETHPARGYSSEKINEHILVDIVIKNLQNVE